MFVFDDISAYSKIKDAVSQLSNEDKKKYLVNKDTVFIGAKVYDITSMIWWTVTNCNSDGYISLETESNGKKYAMNSSLEVMNLFWDKPILNVVFGQYSNEINGMRG